MGTALGDLYPVLDNPVHQPVHVINSPAPIPLFVMLERFRLADAFMPVTINIKQ